MTTAPFSGRFDARFSRLSGSPPPFFSDGMEVLFHGHLANAATVADAVNQTRDNTGVLIAAAYRRWGAQLPLHVLGEFSAVIHDRTRNCLVLCADSLGVGTLFYTADKEGVQFSQYLEDLLPVVPSASLDEEYIADFLANYEHQGERTPFSNIRRLMPGEVLKWQGGPIVRSRPWDWRSLRTESKLCEDEAVERLRHLLHEAVASTIPARGKIWCELSGGLDSSTIASVASRGRMAALEAFTMVYPENSDAEESEWVREVLRAYPMPWHRLNADLYPPFSAPAARYLAEPHESQFVDALLIRYSRMAAEHDVSVILSGQGGDAVLTGEGTDPYFWADDLLRGRWTSLWPSVTNWAAAHASRRSRVFWLRRFALSPAWRTVRGRNPLALELSALPEWLDPTYLRSRNLADRRYRRRADIPALAAGQQFYASTVAASAQAARAGYLNCKERVEFRFPLLYRPLVEFMFSLPWALKLRPNTNRVLQRQALRGILPEKIRLRHGKSGPTRSYFEGLNRSPYWRERLTARPQIVERGYVVRGAWQDAVNRARYGAVPNLREFLTFAALEAWLQHHDTPAIPTPQAGSS